MKIADLANEVNTIPLQLQINFIELCEQISVDCDSQDTVSMTPFDSHLLCAAIGVQTLFIIIRVHHTSKPFGVLCSINPLILCQIFSKF